MNQDLTKFLRTGAGEMDRRERIATSLLQGLLAEEQYIVGMDQPPKEVQIVRKALKYTDIFICELDREK